MTIHFAASGSDVIADGRAKTLAVQECGKRLPIRPRVVQQDNFLEGPHGECGGSAAASARSLGGHFPRAMRKALRILGLRRDGSGGKIIPAVGRNVQSNVPVPGARSWFKASTAGRRHQDGSLVRRRNRRARKAFSSEEEGRVTPDVSIVIPLYNEEACVPHLLDRLTQFLATFGRSVEVILVDDGSTDQTAKLVCDQLPKLRGFKLVKLRSNSGQTPAMAAGMAEATGNVIVFMDGDLQNDPNDIPRLLAKLDEGYDLVSGWRRDRKDRALTRRLPSMVANMLIGIVTGVHLHDYGCTLKAYRAPVLKPLRLYSDMHRFIPALSSRAGARITEIVVTHHARAYGASKYGLNRVLKVAADLVALKMILDFAHRPLHYFGMASFAFLVFTGAIIALWLSNIEQGWREEFIVFPAVIVLFFVTALYFLFLGLLAELINRVGRSDPTDIARATAEVM